ncbi:MAG TPA: hypothetical protein P5518_03480 [Candidatus Cloacimonas sp.]|jgi:antitoxin component YwqK of YwqJK toxin-antitoxin module|nr:hypothetical protein [Candidatus Cloacimonas sp.]MDD3870014.1 hypothetical protein [Candidatus Cloacimonadota bacterium]MCK9165025.1 hypothetical protein [Candidatus Cloacimonas sp.]HNV92360.1 hypothetical protein [Candidatus Cloacimonas sp.]HOU25616.1 hypothetical protein [Candidatus Cloacimonas sp.]
MWLSVTNAIKLNFGKKIKANCISCSAKIIILSFFIFSLGPTIIFAQSNSEEYLEVKNWKAPKDAVAFTELTVQDSIYLYKDKPFTGVAVEHYPNGNLLRAVTYIRGKQSGPMFLWYPDGNPQMSAYYQNGYLHGRFLGWYSNGSVIYDIVINKGTYAGDNLLDEDEGRIGLEMEEGEREGPDNDQSKE